MTGMQQIVLGVDSSPATRRAAEWAANYARKNEVGVVAVHVLPFLTELILDLPPTGFTAWRLAIRDRLEGEWTAAVRDAGVPCQTLLIEGQGETAAALARVADERNAQLIVVGMSGHGGLANRVMGSVTYRLVHCAHQPVVLVPDA